MTIHLYNNTDPKERVVKNLTTPLILSGNLREECDILRPAIRISLASFPSYNYAYIPEFNRYYYIIGITAVRNGVWEITMAVDVLMTYADQIKAQRAIVTRQQNVYNLYLPDPEFRVESKRRVQIKTFPSGFSLTPHYILALAGSLPD